MMSNTNATGNDALGRSGSVSYSIGQVFFTYVGESVYNVAQGVQHSNLAEDSGENINNPQDIINAEISISVYPNPTTDFVNLSMKGVDLQNGQNTYQLFSYQGKLIQQQTIEDDKTQISLSHLSSSMYLLQVFVKNKIWKTFKILKE
ncbi:T9SS type A sorting domain-containing protein [Confluentibacter sediminis]|uniref:T9SS type A sorting domain-containing protein n=1 Tax=Confluentibacter sediminis TaxID=2219045 RepID=UPI0013A6891F|nr:T9SS type A sorting domain-containing protein [Confluentibacter sediminis]